MAAHVVTNSGHLAERLFSTLSEIVPRRSDVVFWDYPVYENVGDIAIYHGTEVWLRRESHRVLDRRSMDNFRQISLDPKVVILLQGGGNFGDLYAHQAFRESVVRAYPDNRIVFLPQTLFYEDEQKLAHSADVLNEHGDLHLVFRDAVSLEIAGRAFVASHRYLAPDMTAALHPLGDFLELAPRGDGVSGETLFLIRTDVESSRSGAPTYGCKGQGDWSDVLGAVRVFGVRQAARLHRYGQLIPAPLLARWWYDVSLRLLQHSARYIWRADKVVTDRLHGHILATMLGVPNVVIDNSYGKNRRYYEAWHEGIGIARFAEDGGVSELELV